MKDRNNGLVMKSAKGNTNRAFGNSISLPNNPLNNISLHMEEVDNSSAQNQQFGLLQTASKLNYKIISDYDVPPNNKTVDHWLRMKLRIRTMNFALMLLVKTCMLRCLNKTTAIHLLPYKHRLMMMMDLWMFKIETIAVKKQLHGRQWSAMPQSSLLKDLCFPFRMFD